MNIPQSTYRLQFTPDFGFKSAREILDFLYELGISTIYASPIFKARKGSTHGYDVVDPNQLNPELGNQEDFVNLMNEIRYYSMGWIQDIVPNHMAFDYQNEMLMNVVEGGENSEFINFFNIQWDHPYPNLNKRVLAPFLGSFYGETLENGEIQLGYDEKGFSINYYDHKFPLKIESYIRVLSYRIHTLKKRLSEDDPDFIKLLGLLYVLQTIPSREELSTRYGEIDFIKRVLWELYSTNFTIKRFIDHNISVFNGKKGEPESFNMLDNLLSEQLFRLSFWKVATEEINYKRFFNINELISLNVEDEEVFNRIHTLIFKLVEEGKFTGLRIDHIDGLYDPYGYLKRLREKSEDTYIIIEKILDIDEELPSFWPIQGTTGYDFLIYINSIFCLTENEKYFKSIYTRFTGLTDNYEALLLEKKRLMMGKHMAGDVDNLAHLMKNTSGRHRHGNDLTLYGLKRAIVEVIVHFTVYRTYISQEVCTESDLFYLNNAIERAIEKMPDLIYELNFIRDFHLFKLWEYLTEKEKKQWTHFVMRFQQATGPLMAKAFEDTFLYVYTRLISLNDVGGSPDKFGISLDKFHNFNKKRLESWPHTLNATSTHDSKRSADVRARINVLSEVPHQWEKNLRKWNEINRLKKQIIKGKKVPDRNDEYFLYQTLIGAFPFDASEHDSFIQRIKKYIIKAVREAKVHTAWLKPDTEYEEAYLSFVEEILKQSENNEFLKEFLPFQKRIAFYGIFNSLSQILIKITSPGIPDFYQGTELWDLSLVDPDNRRPVDYKKRQTYLKEIKKKTENDRLSLIKDMLSTKEDGKIKLFLTHRALVVRNENKELFDSGTYIPLVTEGKYKNNIIAYARHHEEKWVIIIAPRFLSTIVEENRLPLDKEVWDDTHIILPEKAPKTWKNAFTDESITCADTIAIGEVMKYFPLALLS
jgi:(1->4)-alpha-D-glucan 1-alpha-D-glucosylmutase